MLQHSQHQYFLFLLEYPNCSIEILSIIFHCYSSMSSNFFNPYVKIFSRSRSISNLLSTFDNSFYKFITLQHQLFQEMVQYHPLLISITSFAASTINPTSISSNATMITRVESLVFRFLKSKPFPKINNWCNDSPEINHSFYKRAVPGTLVIC